ncbi:hypothetical protein PR202_ga15970 [Eleusine coracana subsp. coracana]|uniref:Uncharacterized protein n=1 Tax=Eleusine coracana subsp. coracana TaxID=191504 RepID=A0AAV5CKD4_ELECO|nr:hypothetical protein PR202_ga15970 [Eleusine coracana subsp. coracana]
MFWKASNESSVGDCQVAWEKACCDKQDGGLGIKDLHTQNLCLLLKYLHKIVTKEDTPWVRWILQQYKPFERRFEALPSHTNAWKTLA